MCGASGSTGRLIVRQALGRGWDVRAPVRHDPGFEADERLEVVRTDVLDPASATAIVRDADAVLSVLGFHRRIGGPAGTTVYSDAARSLVTAMGATGVRRLVFCTSAGVEDHDPHDRWVYDHVVRPLWLRPAYDDMRRAEAALRGSDLDWVAVRPGRLTDHHGGGTCLVSARFRPEHANSVPRADLATFMLDQATDDRWLRSTPTLGAVWD